MPLTVRALDHLVVNVFDVEVSAAWYARALGMARVDAAPEDGKPPRTEMRFGQQKINLRPIATSKEEAASVSADMLSGTRRPAATTSASLPPRRPMKSSGI